MFFVFTFYPLLDNRKKLVVPRSRRECVYKRADVANGTFFGKEERRREREVIKNRRERYKVRDDVVGVTGFEPAASCSQSKRATNCATPRYY